MPHRPMPRRSGRASSCRSPAGRRAPSRTAGPARSPCAARCPRRARAPGRRSPRACAGACARAMERRAGPRGSPRARHRPGTAGRSSEVSIPARVTCPTMQQETTDVLQRLVRFNTVNPPGDEREAQEYLAGYLQGAGLEVELLGRTEARPNLVARLRGTGDGPTLCLLSHVDTVLATASEWERDPWSGDVVDGVLWGRGALDMKSQTAAEAVAAATLARSGWRGKGDLLVVVVVDEETGGAEGAQWICEQHPDKVRCDYLLNEGAGTVIPFDGTRVFGVCVAEKGVFRFKLRTRGVAGHASIPRMGDNALLKLAPLLQAMKDRQPGFDVTSGPQALLDALGLSFEELRDKDPVLALLVEPMLGVTLAPTRAQA